MAAIHNGPDGAPLVAGIGTGGRRPCADTRFEIGSITKTFTALALAQTVVAGRLSLDTRVRGLLPAGGPSHPGMVSISPWSTWRGTLQACRARREV